MNFSPELTTVLMFSSLLFFIVIGAPLAWALLISGTGFAYLMYGPGGLNLLVISAFSTMNNFLLVALPLFIFMGLVLERSGITDDLFELVQMVFSKVPGGLGVGTVVICAIIAAMAGVSGAATVSLGIIALPAMLRRGYDKRLITGTIMAGGALGFLIPPSVVMIVYAFLSKDSVGRLFAAGVVPGLMLAGIYMLYILIRCRINPSLGPTGAEEREYTLAEKIAALRYLIAPGVLVTAVLGCIIGGITSPSEAAAIGAGGALIIAAMRGKVNRDFLSYVIMTTGRFTGMLMWIALAAVLFSKVYSGLGAGQAITDLIARSDFSPMGVIIIMLISYFLMGMFLDDFAISFITLPIYVPIVHGLGFDTVWFAILFVLSMQSAYLTPPFGYNLFYMRSVAPKEITTQDIYLSTIPFIILQVIGLILVMAFPQIALWLPNKIFG